MLQLNLLPDIKVEYMNARRIKHRVYVISFLAVGISVGVLMVLVALVTIQKRNINNLTTDIKSAQKDLESIPDLAKIVTIQNQLNTLPGIYSKNPVTSRLFSYIEQTTPSSVKLSSFKVDYADSSFTIQGSAATLEQVNLYADTLKFTKYSVVNQDQQLNAFNNVTLSDFSRTNTSATFSIKLTFDVAIFDKSQEVTLVVPKSITTRSNTEAPNDLFEANKETE